LGLVFQSKIQQPFLGKGIDMLCETAAAFCLFLPLLAPSLVTEN